MKKIAAVLGAFGAFAVCSPALATGGPILVKSGQTVHLGCNVPGAVDVASGGSVISNCDGQTTIGGSVDVHPGAFIDLCQTTIGGSFIARHAAAGSYLEESTINGANLNDGSVGVSTTEGCRDSV
ncbi:MAG TPA: hypothetical protein VIJ51_00755 [Solirubrobacteraceae bacterium]